ncbi:molybdopterin-dependent oxidoreductase [Streptomyces sp. NBC_01497]|uniref:molybdopterin-dependent oxidoreductase n=1 Tax=Streptomyces sp. NBC_01497 TaxID=2903885 RepID=UPI002E38121A|nr:molybdopterin-dependent oxidoreductase [Streptomyces sp. NBC_01497]
MPIVSRGFHGRRPAGTHRLPPGQYETSDFPVLSAGPTPRIDHEEWRFTLTTETGAEHTWDWAGLMALPAQTPTVDLHCVTKWSKFETKWRGVSLDVLLEGVETAATHTLVDAYGGYTTNLPLGDLLGGRAWLAHRYEGEELAPEHGGPVRLLVPHLYLWKSAKWVRGMRLTREDEPGFWESVGYHDYGDPWREQRYQGD